MHKVSAIYVPPEGADIWFDRDYYNAVHVPMMARDFAGKVAFTKLELQWNVTEMIKTKVGTPSAKSTRSPADVVVSPFVADIYFDAEEDARLFADFVDSEDAASLHADVPKYTNCDIQWVISEVELPG